MYFWKKENKYFLKKKKRKKRLTTNDNWNIVTICQILPEADNGTAGQKRGARTVW